MQGLPLIASGRTPTPLIARCGACGLYKTCRTPKKPVPGKGRPGVMVGGESPGPAEADQLRGFSCDTAWSFRSRVNAESPPARTFQTWPTLGASCGYALGVGGSSVRET